MKKIIFFNFMFLLNNFIRCILLLSLLLLGCAGARFITITPWSTGTKTQIAYSFTVDFVQVQDKYGPTPTPIILETENLRISLIEFLKMRGTFPKRKFKMIKGNFSDFVLRARIGNLSLLDTWSGFEYSVTIEARLVDREGKAIGTYRGISKVNAGRSYRFKTEHDREPINKAMNIAFTEICKQIEQDYLQNKIKPSTKPVEKDTWNKIENILISALDDNNPEIRLEAIWDLSEGIGEGHFDEKSSTIESLISKLADDKLEVRLETVEALGFLGKNAILLIPELIKTLRDSKNKNKCAFAAITLAEIEPLTIDRYREDAINSLIESLPKVTDILEIKKDPIFPTGKVNYRVRREVVDNYSSGMSDEIETLLSKCGKYVQINKTTGIISHYTYETSFLNRIIEEETIGIYITLEYTIFAGSYSLSKITGEDFGIDQDKWRKWWKKD